MATYLMAPTHEKLNLFFGEFFRAMRKAPSQAYGQFLARAEEEFKRLGFREKISSGVENILIVRFDAIGDMILTSGFIREVRANFPRARITLLVCSDVRPVVELCPYVNEVLSFDRNLLAGNFVNVMERIAVFCRDNLWQRKFSIAFSPRWSTDTFFHLVMAWLSGARERIGYSSYPLKNWTGDPPPQVAAQDKLLLTKNIVTPRNVVSDAEKNFYLLQTAGFKITQTNMELFYTSADTYRAKELLEDIPPACKKVVLGIGAREASRCYPVEKYLIALTELAKKNLVFVVVGDSSELDAANFLEQNLPHGKILNLVGKTSLRESEALTAQADFYLGNVTGNMHMAAAAKIPVLALYREAVDRENILNAFLSEYHRFPPYQTKTVVLRPAHQLDECETLPPVYGGCHHPEAHCITQITPQEIIAGFEQLEKMV